jgi:hypothetical protein
MKGDHVMEMRLLPQIPALALTVSCILLLGLGPVFGYGDSEGAEANRIEGLWDVKEEILSGCPDGETVRIVPDLNMFIHGGHLIETPGTPGVGAPPLKRGTPGLGTWQRLGKRHYSAVFRFFRFNGDDDSFAGTQIAYKDIELSEDGDAFTSTGTTDIFDADNNFITTRCSKGTAIRLE